LSNQALSVGLAKDRAPLKRSVISPEENMSEEFNKEFNDIRLKQYSIAMEALNDLFHRIPFGEEIRFSDGRTGTIKPFFEPN
jgi:hypothetical protein